ncbi:MULTISPECIES: biotin/lipoyl-containing protein [unclassified Imperialibacter]|uniref:biotin/lipoyl-containing protein n=1 Tax=unclassified Imperialibacter TaxID=2629706 RepID=UPI001251C439|nr:MULTISPECIES: biotin/lipoyl-containing protein [unclassified Imperialibacter]CAD5271402.1 Pyruvate carboxylase subunit B [Imperialibacter sp. 89]CAD5298796.1 Pyruvate carboxylase subunit B [Imperialibacter sp. 75]VVT35054.1 Pyruvate carboxylase subunit B [Imperialibacter sp. EC-SDR9]
MSKEIGLCLVYRDMWQSSGKYMPRKDQLVKVAGPIVDMGCWRRVETNGGGFEQINLLYGENPNRSVREWTQPFNDAGIQTQMLERGLNGLRMYPVPMDVRELMFKVKKKQGTDISRSFDGLNDTRSITNSIKLAKKGGMIAQAALSITHSPIHTVDYFVNMAGTLIEAGADEIAVKDMAGIGRPASIGKIVAGIKAIKKDILVQYHGHSGPGFSVVSSLEAARAGADIIDVGMEPLSWGTGHADLLTVHAMLRDAGFSLPDINMKAYMQVRSLTQEFIDDFLGYYIDPKNRLMNSLLIGPGLPGGMMGSLMADLEKNLVSVNKAREKNGEAAMSQDDLLIKLFEEVEHIWPKMGYPPLVTPYSQYVKNAALMNVMQMNKGKERWSMLDDNTWDMMLGNSGQLPGPVADELKALAKAQNREFFEGDPHSLYPNELEKIRGEMKEKGWDVGEDEEELLEYAMHPKQYIDYKSGKAKKAFDEDLTQRKTVASAPAAQATSQTPAMAALPQTLLVDVNGEAFRVTVSYDGDSQPKSVSETQATPQPSSNGHTLEILAPLEGKFFATKDAGEKAIKPGDIIKKGDTVGYIEAMKVINAISADKEGTVVEVCFKDGQEVYDDDVLVRVKS